MDLMDKIVSLCKRRGFIFQSSEIYGGLNGCWDYGPLGVELLNNIKQQWWKSMTFRDDIVGLDAAILMHPKVWEASGHVENFTDPMVDCKKCKARFRVDELYNMQSKKNKDAIYKKAVSEGVHSENEFTIKMDEAGEDYFATEETVCPNCGNKGTFTTARKFNLMFRTHIGAVEDESSLVYLRPETAQGIYVNFLNVKDSSRQKIPFGIAQLGKAFRNEINTKNFLFRTREFEQMEMQYFVKPPDAEKWFEYWKEQRFQWYKQLTTHSSQLRLQPHPAEKLAHYAKAAVDIEYKFPFGWGELEGIHNRADFDLKQHSEFSGKKLEYYDEITKERYLPYIIETSAGASRGLMAFLVDAYDEDEAPAAGGKMERRTVLHLNPKLAPVKCAVFPLVNKDGLQEIAGKIKSGLQNHFKTFYDDSGAVGRRYRRQDECGTPFCVTVDYDTLKDNTVTIRDRDSMKQVRVSVDKIKSYIQEKLDT